MSLAEYQESETLRLYTKQDKITNISDISLSGVIQSLVIPVLKILLKAWRFPLVPT